MIRTTYFPDGFHVQCKVSSRYPVDQVANEMIEQAVKCARFHHDQRMALLKSSAQPKSSRREEEDRLRIRLASVERRQQEFESDVKTAACAFLLFGLGIAAYRNWTEIDSACRSAWQSAPTLDAVKQGLSSGWGRFASYFRTP